jgi:hypothetical protein
VRLGPQDNVVVLATGLAEGEIVEVTGMTVAMVAPLTLGHKIAARSIEKGETIFKYGAPIGVATQAISIGAHVHVHNVRSNYIPSYVLPEQS